MSTVDGFINVFLGKALRAELDRVSNKYHRSRAEIIRQALIHFLCAEENNGV